MRLLITGAWKYTQEDIETLKQIGFDCFFQKDEKAKVAEELFDVDGVICNSLFLYNDITLFANLKFVQLTSAGLDRIPLDYLNEKSIAVYNASGVYSIPISEFVISSILDIYKSKTTFYENQKKHAWEKQRNILELNEKVVCIVGCGSVGKECAKLFRAFGCTVYGVDLIPFEHSLFQQVISFRNIKQHLRNADIVVLTLPLTESTKHCFNKQLFEVMKKTSILVNVARGGIIKTEDLINALESEMIGGAVLDVFESEPLTSDSKLWDFSNVIISPHNSFIGDGNNTRLSKLIFTNLSNYEKKHF